MNILDLDIGNTRMKWRLKKDGCHKMQAYEVAGVEEAIAVLREEIDVSVDYCRLASVRSAAFVSDFIDAFTVAFDGASIACPDPSVAIEGVSFGKADPCRLGVDRWLAMIAAKKQYPGSPVVIADSGTALTVDVVDKQGAFQGGLICPGLRTMVKSITDAAALLEFPEQPVYRRELAFDSLDAIQNGALAMAASVVEKEKARAGDDAVLILTGGDGPAIADSLSSEVQLYNDLVLMGLDIALPVQRKNDE